ncbi:P-loop containing nucleoside triphosphate hydrolase protein [Mycena pura]|uniref:P-loop containing nucleoside triphosphate hydrolase protein n=1 Tax=Mycena pura TaxID=153505 RepID=A0AAD6VD34_9AGAR|nr:P-loop containing nucleoside triphosphate hydrolase protein [Mycena pura]
MPGFLPLKRKTDDHEQDASRKRVALDVSSDNLELYWVVQWRNYQAKKHKTWDGDGVLVVGNFKSILYDSDGKLLATGKRELPYEQGRNLVVGGKDVELDRPITREEYLSGACFGVSATYAAVDLPTSKSTASKPFIPLHINRSTPCQLQAQASTRGSERKAVPLQPVDLLSTVKSESPALPTVKAKDSYWTANWRKPGQNKKHKTWDGDAFVSNVNAKLTMITEEGKIMGTTPWKGDVLHDGYHVYIGGKEVQLECEVTAEDLPVMDGSGVDSKAVTLESKSSTVTSDSISSPATSSKPFVAPTSFYGGPSISKPKLAKPLHDPMAEGAVVMKPPTKEHIKRFNKRDYPVVDVVLDPILACRMRPHQIEGVKFMYECVMGLKKHEGQGCILADEMGLGKTLQTIGLIWTLLKQNPYAGAGPVVGKVLIVCPVSLINNWKAEIFKWLGRDRLGVVANCDKDKNAIRTFQNAKNQHVLIVGYERLRSIIPPVLFHRPGIDFAYRPPIGLIVCDEAHRLKSANSKTTTMFEALKTPRRILLSGTPVQNDLSEFHAMADFCNPGLLEEYSTFRRVYEAPILSSRDPESTYKERELGKARLKQLQTVTDSFVLRREAALLLKFLPPKHEYVVFVPPTRLQLNMFSKILNPERLDDLVQSSTAESLALINMLTKVSNSPILLKATADKQEAAGIDVHNAIKRAGVHDALKLLPENARVDDMSLSGKLAALSKLLKLIYQKTDEKCVVVSHYTSTLNILEAYCKKKNYSYYRVDGQTPAAKRQEYVNSFNKSNQRSSFIFLLSSKAGGVGINLIGGSRMCLFDCDWNPSHDEQSMARCHRDGQKRPVYIYRFLTAGAIDEKIFQRQVTKLGLSKCKQLALPSTSGASSKSDSFSRKDLRDIFRIHPDTLCNTHDLLGCACDGSMSAMNTEEDMSDSASIESDLESDSAKKGFVNASQIRPEDITKKVVRSHLRQKRAELAALSEWQHINCLSSTARDEIQDDMLRNLVFVPEVKSDGSKPQSQLLAALDAAAAMSDLTVKDLPGGSVSFLFTKSSIEGAKAEINH